MNEVIRLENLLDQVRGAKAWWVELLDCYNSATTWFTKYTVEKTECKAKIETFNLMEIWLNSALYAARQEMEKES